MKYKVDKERFITKMNKYVDKYIHIDKSGSYYPYHYAFTKWLLDNIEDYDVEIMTIRGTILNCVSMYIDEVLVNIQLEMEDDVIVGCLGISYDYYAVYPSLDNIVSIELCRSLYGALYCSKVSGLYMIGDDNRRIKNNDDVNYV